MEHIYCARVVNVMKNIYYARSKSLWNIYNARAVNVVEDLLRARSKYASYDLLRVRSKLPSQSVFDCSRCHNNNTGTENWR